MSVLKTRSTRSKSLCICLFLILKKKINSNALPPILRLTQRTQLTIHHKKVELKLKEGIK